MLCLCKVVELAGGGSVINGATLSCFCSICDFVTRKEEEKVVHETLLLEAGHCPERGGGFYPVPQILSLPFLGPKLMVKCSSRLRWP